MDSDRDTSLNDELRALVQVAPSPDFTARVRQQLRGETIAPATLGRWPWLAVAAAAVAAIVVTIGLDRRAPTLEPPSGGVRSERASSVPTTSPFASSSGHVIERRDGGERARNTAAAIRQEHAGRHAVLISPEEAEGVALLVARIEDGRLNGAAFDGTPQPPESIDIASAALESIAVESLAPIPPLEGAIP